MALANNSRTATLNAQSMVGEVTAAYLNANIQSTGSLTLSITIGDTAVYVKNKTEIDKDIEVFKTDAIKAAQGGTA